MRVRDLFNEGYKLQLERDGDLYVLHILDTKTYKRTEVRGKSGYESGNYDPTDDLHQLLDALGKSVDISQLMNGEPVGIRPNHPHGKNALVATHKAFNEAETEPQDSDFEAFNARTQNEIARLKAKYPHAKNLLSALLAQATKNDTDGELTDMDQNRRINSLEDRIKKLEDAKAVEGNKNEDR